MSMLKFSMAEIKMERFLMPPSVVESLEKGLSLPSVIEEFPSPHERFFSDESTRTRRGYPLVMGCIVNDAGETKDALMAITKEQSRDRGVAYRFLGKACLTATIFTF